MIRVSGARNQSCVGKIAGGDGVRRSCRICDHIQHSGVSEHQPCQSLKEPECSKADPDLLMGGKQVSARHAPQLGTDSTLGQQNTVTV